MAMANGRGNVIGQSQLCCQKTMFRMFQSLEQAFFFLAPREPACFLTFLFFYLLVFQCSNVPRKTQQIPKKFFITTRGSKKFLCGLNRSLGLAACFSRNIGTKCKTHMTCLENTGQKLCPHFWNIQNKSAHSWNKAHAPA